MAIIYILLDPLTGEIRYVGFTSGTMKDRLTQHTKEKRGKYNHRICWIQSLLRNGSMPVMQQLQEVHDSEWRSAERYWIAYFRSIGCPLTNLTDGGDGTIGYNHSEESKAKMSASRLGKTASKECREKMSASRKGKVKSEETRSKIRAANTGHTVSAETRAKIGAANKIAADARSLALKQKKNLPC